MSNKVVNIWGRDFDLEIIFDCYSGEEVLPTQKEALEKFLEAKGIIEDSKTSVEKYCLKWNKEDINSETIDNIFKYVKPKSLFIKRTDDNTRVVAILCAYKFYSDNKIAVVFTNEKFDKVVIDDEII